MKRIGVLVNSRKPHAAAVLKRLAERAKALGLELTACDDTAKLLPGCKSVSAAELAEGIDVLMALGGDGTVLRAVRALNGADKPVLGVNLGSLGFLTSVTEEELDGALEVLQKGSFTTSLRSIADCRLIRGSKTLGNYRALNDAVIGWGTSSRVNTLALDVNGEQVAIFTCDGLIVSTPTGSTGHSLSAGGPILTPDSPCFLVNPICPHTLSNRPLVVSDQSAITVHVAKALGRLVLSVDGQEEPAVEQGDRLEVRRSPQSVRFIHLPGYSYFSVLRQKLLWRGSSV
ncbi:MAG: hypothetical protein BWK77_03060 [Verrucomicrobia bacterium A1]|nr:MAG: hypothetical protein BWK77_03060 [Verrucomicrobia bacterium A1]